jgi:hypothetical protein
MLPVIVIVALAGVSFAVAAQNGGLGGHSHTEETHPHDSPPAAEPPVAHSHPPTPVAANPSATDVSRHDHGVEVNVSWEQLREVDGLLTRAKAATDQFRDVNAAYAAGYIQVTQVVPGLGAHFVQPALLAAGRFDVEHPAILLYDRAADGGFELVGVSWSMPKRPGNDTPPPAPFGDLATWHYHTDLCFSQRAGSPFVSANTAAACRAQGGAWVRETGWMMHAWLFRPSPEGVFSHQNSSIKGTGAALAPR